MVLTLDIGNSRMKSAVFGRSGELLSTDTWNKDNWQQLASFATNQQVDFIIYSSVANEPPADWVAHLESLSISLEALSDKSPLPFDSNYRSMDTLGRDRIAAIAGAIELLPDTNCLIADMGTCLTMDLLIQKPNESPKVPKSQSPTFMGGNISPGLQMRLKAMHEGTKRLPLVSVRAIGEELGLDTESALLHGGLGGLIYEIEGLYARLCAKFPDLRLLITGGDAHLVQVHLAPASLYQPHLVHYGLYKISTLYAA
ncbi:MAG: type III pantothenate kinase [Bacteroidota bacterium]